MWWSEVLAVAGESSKKGQDTSFEFFVFDTRKLVFPDRSVFLGIKGAHHNGNHFVKAAYERGVRHFIVEEIPELPTDARFLQVSGVIPFLQKLAKSHREKFRIPVIGITGSNGKTTCKEWLSQMLALERPVVKNPKSFNSQLGVPLSVLQMNAPHELAVFEAGISTRGEMANLQQVIQPTIGLFTNLGPAHAEGFSSLKEKLDEKILLFSECEKIVCCADQTDVFEALSQKYGERVISWSEGKDAHFKVHFDQETCTIKGGQNKMVFRLPFTLPAWREDAVHVIILAHLLGVSEQQIQKGITFFRPVSMRLQLRAGKQECTLIDDTYNNDLQGLEVGLSFLSQQKANLKKTVILSEIMQTGDTKETYALAESLLIRFGVSRLICIGEEISKYPFQHISEVSYHQSVDDFFQSKEELSNEIVLIKGARPFRFERIVDQLSLHQHRTVLEINLEALSSNLAHFRSLLPGPVKLMVMVKAQAYGIGGQQIAQLLAFHNVDYLGVAYLDEGKELRNLGIKTPIMVMNPDSDQLENFSEFDLQAEIFNSEGLHQLSKLNQPPKIQIKIDTGMNRLGFKETEIPELVTWLKENQHIIVSGIFTHLSSSDDPHEDEFSREQLKKFDSTYDQLTEILGYRPLKHALNTAGLQRFPANHYDMVRLGIGLYGHDPAGGESLVPVGRLRSVVSQVKQVAKGESIGYARKGKADQDVKIATVPIGYADGYLRKFGNGTAKMRIGNDLVPTIGNICMDMCMLDVTGLDVHEGDEVEVFGENPTIEMLAEWGDTIPYEIITNVNTRVPRNYRSE